MGRAPCCDKANVKKGPWSPEEDSKLKDYIDKYGTGGNWIALPQKVGLKRCGKSCRLRWLNYLRPNIKHGGFSDEEDRIILTLFASIGSRWSIIASQLPGRTDNDIKNYWNTKLKKKLMGVMIPNPNQRLIKPSPSSQIFPPLSIYHHHNSPLMLPYSQLPLSSPLMYRDNLCYPSPNATPNINAKSSMFTNLDFSSSVEPMSLLNDHNDYPTNPSSMLFQTHEGNAANAVEATEFGCGPQMIIKQERSTHDHHHHELQDFISDGSEESHHHRHHQTTATPWEEEKRSEGYYGESNSIGSSSALEYELEEMKRLIGSSNSGSGSSNFLSSLY